VLIKAALLCVALTVGIALVPASMAAGTRSASSPPAAGTWKLHSINNGAPEVKSGSFTLTSHLFVTGFQLTLGPGAEIPCGTGNITVKVVGDQQLTRDPTNDLGDPSNEYAVSSPTNVTTPIKITVTVNGKHQAGAIDIAFGPGTRGGPHTGGELYYNDNNCDLAFGVTKA
jgi:hypothetical protein